MCQMPEWWRAGGSVCDGGIVKGGGDGQAGDLRK